MTEGEFGSVIGQLFLLVAAAHIFGWLFARLQQPRVIGEIFAGLMLGPSILGHFAPRISTVLFSTPERLPGTAHDVILSFLYNFGLLLLMFVSGTETKGLFSGPDRREIAWLGILGTALPFLLVIAGYSWLPLGALSGPSSPRISVVLVVGIAISVTSIPVISRILHDLGILQTRFSRLVLGVAMAEDIALWAILAIATALARSSTVPRLEILRHAFAALAYFAIGLKLAPAVLARLSRMRWNVLASISPVGYVVVVLFAYAGIASALHVSIVFAAFLAGFGIIANAPQLSDAVESVRKLSFAVFIPIYFAIVGFRLDLSKTFSISLFVAFLVVACSVKLISVGVGARLAGFGWLDTVNLAMATNARGGPGIVLASVAFDAGIINAAFYTTLVLVAVLTSQAAGTWLRYVLRKGWPLLSPQKADVMAIGISTSSEHQRA
jgi:Kef-type K+ transport system membrane component KefB